MFLKFPLCSPNELVSLALSPLLNICLSHCSFPVAPGPSQLTGPVLGLESLHRMETLDAGCPVARRTATGAFFGGGFIHRGKGKCKGPGARVFSLSLRKSRRPGCLSRASEQEELGGERPVGSPGACSRWRAQQTLLFPALPASRDSLAFRVLT